VLATVYHDLGIDPHELVRDISERPVPILPGSARPIRELISSSSRLQADHAG
jgi:hypothetical protein